MEKFSTWRDKASGEHPFLPNKKPSNVSALFVAPLFILRFVCLLFLSLCLLILCPISFLVSPVHRILRILIRTILFVSGFQIVKENCVRSSGRQKGILKPFLAPSVILSNHQSYLDSLTIYAFANCLVAHSCPSNYTDKYVGNLYEPIRFVFHRCPSSNSNQTTVFFLSLCICDPKKTHIG